MHIWVWVLWHRKFLNGNFVIFGDMRGVLGPLGLEYEECEVSGKASVKFWDM